MFFRDVEELLRTDPESIEKIEKYKSSIIPSYASAMLKEKVGLSALEGPNEVLAGPVTDTVKRGRGKDKSFVMESDRQSKCRRLLEGGGGPSEHNGCFVFSF